MIETIFVVLVVAFVAWSLAEALASKPPAKQEYPDPQNPFRK